MTHSFSRRGVSLLLALLLAFSLVLPASAEDEGGTEASPAEPDFTLSAELSRSSMQLINSNTLTVTPEVTGLPADASVSYSYDWSIQNTSTTHDGEAVCTISNKVINSDTGSAIVTAAQAGTARVSVEVTATVTSGDGVSSARVLTKTCDITVPGIVIDPASASVLVRHSYDLKATVYGDEMGSVSWSSGNESVATVFGSGNNCTVRGVSAGSTFVSASVTSGGGQTYSATCYVTVNPVNVTPVFVDSVDAGSPLVFSSILSDMNNQCRQALDTSLSYVTSLSVPTSAGTLYYGYVSEAEPGFGVGTNENYYYSGSGSRILSDVTFVPKSDFSGTTTIRYAGFNSSGDFYDGTIEVSVSSTAVISYSTTNRSRIDFELEDFNNVCKMKAGHELQCVSFTLPASSKGVLYYNYAGSELDNKVTENTLYYRSKTPYLENISLVPADNYTGSFTIRYTGRDTSNTSYSGTVSITVSSVESGSGDIHYSASRNRTVRFDVDDFNELCRAETGSSLNYIRFTSLPSSSRGTLYYNYSSSSSYGSKVSTATNYRRTSSPYLDYVSFVPASGWTGDVDISFTGYAMDGDRFTGTVGITIGSGSSSSDTISYSARKNGIANFDVDDFNDLCLDQTGSRLSYVRFTLPSSSRGTLYYNYSSSNTKVSSSTNYNRNSYPYLDDVSFVPASGWTGSVDISFTGYSVDGDRFTGTVEIDVSSSTSTSGTISYSARQNSRADFDVDDFDNMCQSRTGSRLSYVRFTLPSSSRGTLYYNYSSSNTKVSSSTNYNRSSYPYLDYVSFVPASGWTGTVDISFTGYSVNGDSFTGTVEVDIGGTSTSGTISYTTRQNSRADFDVDDFDDMCQDRTGSRLSYIRFTLPSSSRGTLYYNYTSANNYGSKVSSSTNYRRTSSPYLDDVSFVPASGWTGSVSISFTGYSVSSESFSGTVKITVEEAAGAGGIYLVTSAGNPITFQTSSFQSACNARGAGSFVSATFTLPSANAGRLYCNYVSASQPGTAVTSTQSYRASGTPAISSITFVPAAGYSGAVTIPYTGTDNGGATYSGTVVITVSAPTTTSFTDLDGYDWAKASIEYLYANGVVNGTGNGKYSPAAPITRGSFMLMLCRAFHFSDDGTGSGFADVPADSVYADALRAAKALGIAQGSGGYFYPSRPLSREQAAVFLLRALRADGWTIADGTRSTISGFADAASVSDYAVGAVGAMVQYNILQGSNGYLSPQSTLTRAQMAVILHRALTL